MNLLVLYLLVLLALESGSDDPILLKAIKNGDHNSFKKFFDHHHSFLLHFLLKRGMSQLQAEDLVQQAFVMIWEKRSKIDPGKSLRSYLFRIAYTRMLNVIRDNKKFEPQTEAPEFESGETADRNLDNSELAVAIETAIASMPEKRQTVFRLCFIQEFTYKDAAEVLNVTVKTVENHMGLALKELRGKLEGFR